MNIEADCEVNIILLGESDVGKTSLLLRFVEDKFKDSLPKTSIKKYEKIIDIENSLIKLILWDTAGRKAYYGLVKSYYKIADAAMFVYDIQNANTFFTLSKWLDDFRSVNENAEVLIAGNKTEDENKNSVNLDDIKHFAQTKNIDCIEVSAKSCRNVNIVFHHLVQKILVAKGILPYSNDCLPTELEKTKAYISSTCVRLEPQKTIETPSTLSTTSTSESLSIHTESTELHTTSTMNIFCTTESLVPCTESSDQYMSNTINAQSLQESLTYRESTEQDLNTSNIRTNESLMPNEVYEMDDDDEDSSLNDYGFVLYSTEDLGRILEQDF